MKWLAASGALAVALASPLAAAAASDTTQCPSGDGLWLRLDIDSSLPPLLAATVAGKLRAELDRRDIAICTTTNERKDAGLPLADIDLRIEPDDMLALAIIDRATDKRLTRSISLRGIPPDARALSIAVAADELLLASWLEALLDQPAASPAAVPSPPTVVERIAVESLSPRARAPREERGSLALAFAGEHATGGQSLGGVDARASYGATFRVGVRLGYRLGVVAAADHGNVESSALVGGVALGVASPRASPWGAELFARADALQLAFSGRALGAAHAWSGAALGVLAGGGVDGWRSLDANGVWRVVGEISLALPLRAVAALDDGHLVTALSGVVFGLALGVGAAL
jgi:hypothetical protein